MLATFEIARFTLREAARRRLLLAGLAMSLGFVALFGIGFWLLHQEILERVRVDPTGSGRFVTVFVALMTLLGLYVVNLMASLLALFMTAGTVAGEVESGALQAVLTKPLHRRDVVLGKWLGHSLLVTVYVVATSAGLLALVAAISGYVPPRPLQAIGLMLWSSLVLLAISLFGSTFMPTLANSVVVFLMFGLSWLGGFVEAIGTTLESEPMVTLGIVASLIIPSDALWRGASYYLQPVSLIVMQSSSRGGGTIFSSATPPAPAMLVWSAVYLVGMIVAAVVTFERRDL